MARKTPEIPSASLADIAFMLLIFFLVTTTMDVDSGLERRLPPFVEEIDQDTPPIKERNVFIVLVNRDNNLLVEGEWMQLSDLRERAKEFMANPADRDDLPEKEMVEVEFFGEVPVSKGVISLQNELKKFGAILTEPREGELKWDGMIKPELVEDRPVIETYNDHRMALAFAPLAISGKEIIINNPQVVTKSYPDFWSQLSNVGFKVT